MDLRQKHTTISIYVKKKTFDKNLKFLHGKNPRDGTFLTIIKVILYGEKLVRIPVKSGIRCGCSLSLLRTSWGNKAR